MASEESKKKKCPTALKRMRQSEKKRMANRSFKARVRTAIRSLRSAHAEKNSEKTQTLLQAAYSLIDKGVKTKVFKKNKAARTKSQLSLLQKSA